MIDVIKPLRLNPHADSVARELLAAFPEVTFTSGRRDRDQQARAMARNVVEPSKIYPGGDRKWISREYIYRPIAVALQQWIDQNPRAFTLGQVANGLSGVLKGFSDEECGKFSLHMSGDAFDLLPVHTIAGNAVRAWLRARTDIVVLENEQGKDRLHVQTKPIVEQPVTVAA